MFELELINLLNEYQKSATEYDRNKIKNSISKLIGTNCEQLESFMQKQDIEPWAKIVLEECYNTCKAPKEIMEREDDYSIIKQAYKKWLEEYNLNGQTPNQNCEKIVQDLINFYALNRFDVLKSILEIKENDDYELFKNMLQNYLRKFFASKVETYYLGENFQNLSFFQKRKKKNEILGILSEIGSYNFNTRKINEAIK